MKSKFQILTVVASVFLGVACNSAYAAATLFWGTGTFFAFNSDGTTKVTGNANSAVGGLIELIYLGGDGVYNGFVDVGTGINGAGDDVVAATSWFGQGAMNRAGELSASYASSYAAGSKFMILFFDNPSPNFAASTVPTTGNYQTVQTFTTTADPNLGGIDTYIFDKSYSATTPVAIPEPTTVALMLAGLAVLAGRRFVRS